MFQNDLKSMKNMLPIYKPDCKPSVNQIRVVVIVGGVKSSGVRPFARLLLLLLIGFHE